MLDRISSARSYLEKFGLDALIFLNPGNIRYLAGFSGSEGAVVLGRERAWFLTDSRYTAQAATEVNGFTITEYRDKLEGIASSLRESSVARLGFEAEHTTVAVHKALAEALPGIELVPIGAELAALRIIKDSGEINLLTRSAGIASTAFLGVMEQLQPGITEKEFALSLEFAMKRGGADEKSFDFIVASGPRGAMPHGRASNKAIEAGELVTIDFGAVCDGYHSDETVTVAVGTPDARQSELYGIVKDAHDMAISAVRPGVSFRELDGTARNFIESKGYGAFFGHGLGHGVGLEVHEKPTVSYRGEGVVEEGMVFTIEPGIYIPSWGGIRIEDTVVVTADGCTLLTRVPKDMLIV